MGPESFVHEKSTSLKHRGRGIINTEICHPEHSWATLLGNLGNSLTNEWLAGGP